MADTHIEIFIDRSTDGFSKRTRIVFPDNGIMEKINNGWYTRWSDGQMVLVSDENQINCNNDIVRRFGYK